ncbi:MAG: hypothetical protein H0T66_12660 [Geodermatophilaceae bacterium]|nr:hypothetical protein [Geodermatophilaceae bacterium]MDQ3456495.1 hypothetical protein [Actinomycetota bacterium]
MSAVSGPAVSGRGVRLADVSGLHKTVVRGAPPTVAFGLVERRADGGLALGYGYDEVLLLTQGAPSSDDGVDLTHGLTALRLSGPLATELLSRVCALDLSDPLTPDATLRRCPLAGLAVVLVRDDVRSERSYLLLVDRSYGQALYDVLLDAGAEFGWTPSR